MSKAGSQEEMAALKVLMDKHAIDSLVQDEEYRQLEKDMLRESKERRAMDGCASNEEVSQERMDAKQKEEQRQRDNDHRRKSELSGDLEHEKRRAAIHKEAAEHISKELGLGLPLDLEAEVMKFTVESMLHKFGLPSTPETREEILKELLQRWEKKEMERPRSQSRSQLMLEKLKQGY